MNLRLSAENMSYTAVLGLSKPFTAGLREPVYVSRMPLRHCASAAFAGSQSSNTGDV